MINRYDSGQVELEFGHGDIIVAPATLVSESGDTTYVLFRQAAKRYEIGEKNGIEDDDSLVDNDPDVVMSFNNPSSIDVVIKQLQAAKDTMLKQRMLRNV